jgi:hypothetical protein
MSCAIIVKMKFGAHLYGTATPASDLDLKGIFCPSKTQVLLGRIPKVISTATAASGTRNTRRDVDEDLYSLHYFIKLACDEQTLAMDMLHAPPDMILVSSSIWEEIVAERHRFYLKNLKAFIDYARSQAARYGIKGSRIMAVARAIEVLKAANPEHKLRALWQDLPRMAHCHDGVGRPDGRSGGPAAKQYLASAGGP